MNLNHLTKHTLIYGFADFLGKGFAIIILPFLAAALSPNEFGMLELILTVTGLMAVIMNCGLNNATQRFYFDGGAENIANAREVVSSGAAAILFTGLFALMLGLILVYLASLSLDFNLMPFSIIALISAILLMISNQWITFIIDVTRLHFAPLKFLILASISRVFALAAGTFAVVTLGWGIDGYLSMQALIVIFIIPFALFLIRKDLSLAQSRKSISRLIKFGFPYIFMGMGYWLFGSMDRWMLAGLVSVDEAGIYAVAFKLSSVVLFASAAFGQAWSPFALKLKQDSPEEYREIYSNILYCLFCIMMVIGGFVSFFSGEIISSLFPTEYHDSAYLLCILTIGIIFQSTIHVTSIGISLKNKTSVFAKVAWITAIINLVFNFILIPYFGGVGAAISTSISYFVLTGLYFFYSQKLHKLPINFNILLILIFISFTMLLISLMFYSADFNIQIISFKFILYFLLIFFIVRILSWEGVFKNLKSSLAKEAI